MSCCPGSGAEEEVGESQRLINDGNRPARSRKIVVTGYPGVGKSCVVIQFCENHFTASYNPTIAATFTKTFKLRGEEFLCEIVDTAGQDEFHPFPQSYGVGVHGYVLVYSTTNKQSFERTTNKQSFERIPVLNDKILDVCGSEDVPRILVGNKSDLMIERQVSIEEGRALANELGTQFIECSAKHNLHVADVFKQLLIEIEKQQGAPKVQDEGSCVLL